MSQILQKVDCVYVAQLQNVEKVKICQRFLHHLYETNLICLIGQFTFYNLRDFIFLQIFKDFSIGENIVFHTILIINALPRLGD